MADPLTIGAISTTRPIGGVAPVSPARAAGGEDFGATLRSQLEQVSQMQSEADDNLRQALTGESHQLTDVLVATRKAQIAFSLLMEIRNKLVDAYQELQNMRV